MSLLLVAGTRPNFMKVAPLVHEGARRSIGTRLVHTGQHHDPLMSDVFFDELAIPVPDHHLGVGPGTLTSQTAAIMVAFEEVLSAEAPGLVVVVGDVTSTLACALVASRHGVPVAHVEAGLRSRDWSMPEEINRVVTDRLSRDLFAPSPEAVDNLASEGFADGSVHLVGNIMIDTLLANLDRARSRSTLADMGLTAGSYVVATLHRPSNVDDPAVLAGLVGALGGVAERVPVVLPVHPRAGRGLRSLDVPAGLRLVEPLGYLDMIALQADAALVITDSGGVQEETTVLGVPCVTVRDNTERPITISEGTNHLAGTDPAAVAKLAVSLLDAEPADPGRPALWDGRTAPRILDVLIGPRSAGS